MLSKRIWISLAVMLLTATIGTAAVLTEKELLGKNLFFDTNLSEPKGQACADCHAPEVGFTGPDSTINALGAVYEGAVPGRFGNRKPPAASYGGDSPLLHEMPGRVWAGGMFWDGRATGWTLGDPLAEQAKGPFLNPLEQNIPNAAMLVMKVCSSSYADLFRSVWGTDGTDPCVNVDRAYNQIAMSIASYERSMEVSSFTSKYDYYLKGAAAFTDPEKMGLELFNGKAMCSNCHVPGVFTDFTYDNLGIPKNPLNPFYYEPQWNPAGLSWTDYGIGGFLKSNGNSSSVYQPQMGKSKVPTLRNVDKRPYADFIKAYGHNGYFKSLEQIVHFYNTRDALPTCNPKVKSSSMPGIDCWPAPEVARNINKAEMGNLGLNNTEEDAIVAFMKTLSDGYVP